MKKILFILIIGLFLVSYSLAANEIMTLLTEEEGTMKEAPSGLYEIGRTLNDGPDIKVVKPEMNNEYKPPVKIIVLFVSKDGREVDLSKLKVEALKFLTIDLTKRVLPYTSKEGIDIENAKLPSGKHKIRVTIGDVDGRITQETFVVRVL